MKNIIIIGGGTFNHVRNHLALAVPAFGNTARQIAEITQRELVASNLQDEYQVKLMLTKMADHNSNIVTNDDVESLLKKLIADPQTKAIFFNVALADFQGSIDDVPSGKYAERLKTSHGDTQMSLTPSDKLIGMIRKERKDIFTIGFKTTTGFTPDEQYVRGLELLKNNSLNIVLANDTVERRNMLIVPEEARYSVTNNREEVLEFLVKMTLSRMQNKFTRSTVVEGQPVDWNSDVVPESLRTVVNHCIQEGAYKPFLGKTAGHFAVKIDDNEILTSIRKTNFNNLDKVGLVKIESKNEDEVIAHGFKPSVGGQSQRIIFKENPELDCIVHFHSPVKPEFKSTVVPVKYQWPNECGSHQCGQNTSNGLKAIDLGDGDELKVVYLDEHGPNIVFNKSVPAHKVINFIDKHFDLKQKTGGLVEQLN